MTASLSPLNPAQNAIVMASAGTGKTWQLVTRLLRLLLNGAAPDAILAITFTRKAATEMETRLLQRLFILASADDDNLHQHLREAGASIDAQTITRARGLHERLLRTPRPLRTTTFHAFCQEILRRFPLEADVPPGFELIESHGELADAAWQTLLNDVAREPQSLLARQMEQLLTYCGEMSSLRTALFSFLDHRGDWWAYTEDEEDGVAFAIDKLRDQLGIQPESDPLQALFDDSLEHHLGEFVALLTRHPGVENERQLAELAFARDTALPLGQRFESLQSALLTKEGNPRSRKSSKAQAKSMGGEAHEARFLELAASVTTRTLATRQQLAAIDNWRFNCLWYQVGAQFVDHFQRMKNEQRLLDFTDLEWRSYRLLAHGDNAHWVQYKLDQRIDHLLVDEFQDTNPTQWRMLLPLLQEMAAGNMERNRSVFLVGDAKQSIYRFRRANPRLFSAAQEWLETHIQASTFPLHSSRRSSPAIIECVNQLFTQPQLRGNLRDFVPHTTHLETLWGRVVVLPQPVMGENSEESTASGTLRNPLVQPRIESDDEASLLEARQIANTIKTLIEEQTLIGSDGNSRPLHYGDIMLLLRTRTRVAFFERALRESAIPFIGADRGTLLESLEVRDMIALIQTLLTPFDNLSLANVLRSPVGACSNEDLLALASVSRGTWWERLTQGSVTSPSLQRMTTLLVQWHTVAGQIPIHDLLDRIFCEGNVLERYESAYPDHLRSRVRANLVRFLELALEVDSGRYPSLNHFVARLEQMRETQSDAPDEAPSTGSQRIRIMTIHASKGLESPVVFLADTGNSEGRDKATFDALVRWPTEEPRPESYILVGRKAERDPHITQLLEAEAEEARRESANLLYVAVTRARQMLFISGAPAARGNGADSWYGLLRSALDPLVTSPLDQPVVLERGARPTAATRVDNITPPAATIIPDALSRPLIPIKGRLEIAPSRSGEMAPHQSAESDEDGRLRGIAIHRILQLLSCRGDMEHASLLQTIAAELAIPASDNDLREWLHEARRVVEHDTFSHIFSPREATQYHCEVPLLYRNASGDTVHGIIDRLVITPTAILIIDYKTHRIATPRQIPLLAESYREQLRLYAEGIRQLWPEKVVRTFLLFTSAFELFELSWQDVNK